MEVIGRYNEDGYALIRELIAPEIAQAFLHGLKEDLAPGPIPLSGATSHVNLLSRPAFELYGHHYKPMLYFLWGLTPTISRIVGKELLPTYDYLRIYREGDICRVHSDRYSCEHSLSLTLDYSDGETWDLEMEKARTEPSSRVEADFGAGAHASLTMNVGDAVLYQGVHHRHGRVTPNRNAWSAHLFLHWVDRDGPYRDEAFDRRSSASKVNFSFA
jgi:hypothetical protein